MDLSKMYELAHNIRLDIERLTAELNNRSIKYRELCAAIEKEKFTKSQKEVDSGDS